MVCKDQENPKILTSEDANHAAIEQLILNNLAFGDDDYESNEEEIYESQVIDDTEPEAPEGLESLHKYYFGEWSGVEHLYKLVTQSGDSDEEVEWAEAPPSPPLSEAEGVDLELIDPIQAAFEDEMDDLIDSIKSIMIAESVPVPRNFRKEMLKTLQVDFPAYKASMPKTPEWNWNVEEMLEEDSDSDSDSDSAFSP